MTQERIEIQFKPKGDKQLIAAIKQLDVVTKRLQGTTSKYEKEVEETIRSQRKLNNQLKKSNKTSLLGVKNNRLLGNSFATLRSKLLLVSFAIGLTTAAFKKLLDKMIIQEQAEKKLEVALGKVNRELLNQASALQKITTFGDEAIIEIQALIGSFIKDEEAIKKATKATLDLASAKGMDLKSAGDLVSKTLGSSTNSLSRYGIEVTGAVGSTKRLESLTQSIATLFGGQAAAAANTLGGSVEQMKNAIGDANESIGKAFAPTMLKLSKFFKETAEAASEFFLTFSETPLERTIRQLGEMGKDTKDLQVTLLGIKKDKVFKEMELPLNNVKKLEEDIEKTTSRIKINNNIIGISLNQQGKEYQKLLKDGYNVEDLQRKISEETLNSVNYADALTRSNADNARELLKGYNLAVKNQKSAEKSVSQDEERLQKLLEVQKIIAEINALLGFAEDDKEKGFFGRFFGDPDKVKQFNDNFKMVTSGVMDVANAYITQKQAVLNADKATALAATNSIRSERLRARAVDKINEDFAKKQEELNKKSKRAKRTQTVINNAAAIMEIWADKEGGTFFKIAMSALVAAKGQQQLKAIDAAKYEQGGLVGGRRHSQGGTMIEAERGEYVVSRRGVDAAGLEALNRINAGQGAGGVNISINNPVLSKDVVEDDLIPQIKEAIRRGADIGVG
jgi:frataxin-like iron-binding protein CyaY